MSRRPAIERVCGKCGKVFWSVANKYCSRGCESLVRQELKDAEYLQVVPKRSWPHPDKPGPRHCGEGSGSWDNAVRALEE